MKERELGLIFLIFAQMTVGLNIVISKLLLQTIPFFWLLEIRFCLAALTLLPLHWLTPDRHQGLRAILENLSKKDIFSLLAQALTAGVFFNCLMLTGLHYTDANVAGIITSALPALIAVFSSLFLKEKFSLRILICIGLASLGLLVITLNKFQPLADSHSLLGDLLVFAALLPESAYYILSKLHPVRLPVFLASSLINGCNALILLPIALFTPWPSPLDSAQTLVLLAVSLSTGFFYIFWFMGTKRVDGMTASLSTASMPVATVIFAFLILSEQITSVELVGMGCVMVSILVYAKR